VSAALFVRRVMHARRVAWELCDAEGEGTGHNALDVAQAIVDAGAGELVTVARFTPPDGPPRIAPLFADLDPTAATGAAATTPPVPRPPARPSRAA